MKNNMNLTLTKSSTDPVERLIGVLNEFIDALRDSKKTFSDNVTFCRNLRTNRKKFEKDVAATVKSFKCLQESKQVEIELAFHKALKKLKVIVPQINKEIEEDQLFFLFSFFLKREVNKTLKFVKKSQAKMASQLYSDPTEKIESDPELQKKLIDQWGDLAHDEY